MGFPRKLVIFLSVFLLLGALAVFLLIKGKPTARSQRPLGQVDAAKIQKIVIQQPAISLTLERKDLAWKLTQPVEDVVEKETVERLVQTLLNFSVGSIISESRDRYDQFDVQDASATRVSVYAASTGTPALDIFVGKEGSSYSTCYVRFPDQSPVYIASDLSSWELKTRPEALRLKRVLPYEFSDASNFQVKMDKVDLSLSRSSNTWVDDKTKKTVPNEWVQTLSQRLENWRAHSFGSGTEPADILGFSKPMISVSVTTSSGTVSAMVGNKHLPPGEKIASERFAKTEGRAATLLLGVQLIGDTTSHLKTIPK